MDFENILINLKNHIEQSIDFTIDNYFYSPFPDSEDHALSFVITDFKTHHKNRFQKQLMLVIEYRDSLNRIYQEGSEIDPLIRFTQRANTIDELLDNPSGGYFNSQYMALQKQGNTGLFQDNQGRIYAHYDYLLTINT